MSSSPLLLETRGCDPLGKKNCSHSHYHPLTLFPLKFTLHPPLSSLSSIASYEFLPEGVRWSKKAFQPARICHIFGRDRIPKSKNRIWPKSHWQEPNSVRPRLIQIFLSSVLHLLTMKVLRHMSIPSKQLIVGNAMAFFHASFFHKVKKKKKEAPSQA